MSPTPWPLIACTILGTGCAGAPDAPDWGGEMVDSAGVTIVVNPAEGLWADGEAWRVQEEARFGEFGGDPNYQFGQVGSIALNSMGEILVFDRQARVLRMFSSDGEFVRAVGSSGEGPGQFANGVADVLVTRGDTILIPDFRNRRVNRFSPSGEFLDSWPLDPTRHRPLRWIWNAATSTGVVQLRPSSAAGSESGPGQDELRPVLPDGSFGEVILNLPSGGLLGQNITRYFTPEPVWGMTDSLTVLYGVNNGYRIGAWGSDGSLSRIVTMPYEPRPVSDRDIRALFAYLDQAWLAAGVPPSRLEANHQRVSFEEFFPAFAGFQVGPEGSLWVQGVRAPGGMSDEEIERYNFIEDFGTPEWDVFDRDGRFLGQVAMPPRFQPRIFVGDNIFGVVRDDFDVQYLARMRIER